MREAKADKAGAVQMERGDRCEDGKENQASDFPLRMVRTKLTSENPLISPA